ncbi:Apyrase [Bertholletia excelsa]
MEQKSHSKFKLPVTGFFHTYGAFRSCFCLLVILLLLLIGVYVLLKSGKNQFVSKSSYFTVVVDCGSSGTRVSVYEWTIRRGLGDRELPTLIHSYPKNSTDGLSGEGSCKYHCLQTEPGLDKFVGNYSGVRDSLEPLISRAEDWVPPERHSDTPIFVLATAGLRRVPVEDAAHVLEDVEAVVKEHAFMHRKSWIRVLSGREEAYYGWVALNFKMGNLKKTTTSPTLGLLDLGGSSLQVVMEIDKKQEDELFLKSNIGSFEHQILAYSWPTFGLNEAFDRTVVMLSHSQALRESSGGMLEISHPCLSSSFVQNYTCKGCFGISSTDSESSQIQVQRNEFSSILLVGNPSWDGCKILARAAAVHSSSSDWSPLSDGSNCKSNWVPLTG